MRTHSSKMVPPENYCRKGCAEDHPHPHKPTGLNAALSVSVNTVRGWRMTTETTYLHSLTMTALNFPSVHSPTGL